MFSIQDFCECVAGMFNIVTADDIIGDYGILDIFIPMGMDGRTCGFISIYPTQDYMQVCKRVVVYHDHWRRKIIGMNTMLSHLLQNSRITHTY